MAFSKEEHEGLLKQIAETGGDTENMLDLIQKLRDDYDERIGMENKIQEDETELGGEKWKEKYEELRRKYIDRFFATPEEAKKDMYEVKEEAKEDVKRDGKKVSFEELFEEREG